MFPQQIEAFAPGRLAFPVRVPDPNQYRPQGGWTAARRARAEARTRFERDRQAVQAAEAQRQQQSAAYRPQCRQGADARPGEIRRHNAGIAEMTERLRNGDPEAAVECFSAALHASPAWPEDLPRQVSAAYDSGARPLVLNWEPPKYGAVPETKSVRYTPTAGQEKETARPVTQRRALYRDVLAQCLLLVLHDPFAADEFDALAPAPIRGGKIAVQVKRYRNTVPPTAVRVLHGTVQDVGVSKDVLVTTSGFGPARTPPPTASPLELVSGSELVDLLQRHGLRGRPGSGDRAAADSAGYRDRDGRPQRAGHVLGRAASLWTYARSSAEAAGSWRTTTSSSSTPPGHPTARSALTPPHRTGPPSACPSTHRRSGPTVSSSLPPSIPWSIPRLTCPGFTMAGIRLLDSTGTRLDRLEVSDGRPDETALVLGAFRRRSNGDRDFVGGGRGYGAARRNWSRSTASTWPGVPGRHAPLTAAGSPVLRNRRRIRTIKNMCDA